MDSRFRGNDQGSGNDKASRGKWYHISWKGDVHKSGGIATNIGVHFFDMLIWIFGNVKQNVVHLLEPDKASGYIELGKARVKWYLSLDYNDIPDHIKPKGSAHCE